MFDFILGLILGILTIFIFFKNTKKEIKDEGQENIDYTRIADIKSKSDKRFDDIREKKHRDKTNGNMDKP